MPNISCRIVEVCVFKFENDQARFLLLRRSMEEKVYPGIWQLISGSIEDGEKATDAAMRELTEETNLQPKAFWNVPYVDSFYDHNHDIITVSPLFAAQVQVGVEPKLSAEHFEHGWFSYRDALRKLVWPGQRFGLQLVHDYIVGGEQASQLTRLL